MRPNYVPREVDTPLPVGSLVHALLLEPGTGSGVGLVRAFVLNASRYESDVVLMPQGEDDVDDMRDMFRDADIDLEELLEGPVYVLRNMNNEWLRPDHPED